MTTRQSDLDGSEAALIESCRREDEPYAATVQEAEAEMIREQERPGLVMLSSRWAATA